LAELPSLRTRKNQKISHQAEGERMTTNEAVFSITKAFHTIRGTSVADFRENVEALLGDGSFDRVATSFQDAFEVGVAAATAAVTGGIPGTRPAAILAAAVNAGIASPVPQPGTPAQPAAPPVSLPGAPYPGDCVHGPRVYKDSVAQGRQWRRWDCATPYSKEAQAAGLRCKAENV